MNIEYLIKRMVEEEDLVDEGGLLLRDWWRRLLEIGAPVCYQTP